MLIFILITGAGAWPEPGLSSSLITFLVKVGQKKRSNNYSVFIALVYVIFNFCAVLVKYCAKDFNMILELVAINWTNLMLLKSHYKNIYHIFFISDMKHLSRRKM